MNQNKLIRLGSIYGGKWLCPELFSSDPLIVSAGVGTDTTFDEQLIELFPRATVHAIDPTPRAATHVSRRGLLEHTLFHFHQMAMGRHSQSDSQVTLYRPSNPKFDSWQKDPTGRGGSEFDVISIFDIMNLCSRRIDLLKMDIEGFELDVFADLLDPEAALSRDEMPRQICVEFHDRHDGDMVQGVKDVINYMTDTLARHGYERAFLENDDCLFILSE